jgi:beta-N-acetylhexosaminidase
VHGMSERRAAVRMRHACEREIASTAQSRAVRVVLAATCIGAAIAFAACGENTVTVSTLRTVVPRSAASRTTTEPAPTAKAAGRVHASHRAAVREPRTLARMLGQTIVGRFAGTTPPRSFLDQIRLGELGGVILFSENVAQGEVATRRLNEQLQHAASEGGNPPLLIMTDQEGGEVKRLTWAPPRLAASEMGSTTIAEAEGEATGRALRAVGINVDLAPVADVVHGAASFLHTRSFGAGSALVAERACAFAGGIERQGVGYTLKHFPGLGRALTSTDVQPTTIDIAAGALRRDYEPYLACGNRPNSLVMVSSAAYPSLTGSSTPAVLSSEIYSREIPLASGGEPVTISDDLQAAALASEATPAQRAIDAGLDLLLYAGTQQGAKDAYARLLLAVQAEGIHRDRLERANRMIQALKERVAGASPRTSSSAAVASGEEANSYPESIGAPETVKPQYRNRR